MSRFLLSVWVCALGACDAPPEPLVYPGPTGYLSDRTFPLLGEAIPAARRAESPNYAALLDDGRLSAAVVFGQLGKDGLEASDAGYWSEETFALAVIQAGFEVRGETAVPAGGTRYLGVVAGVTVAFHVFGPERWRFDHDEDEARDLLAAVVGHHELVYLNGHAKQPHLDVLGDPSIYPSHRLLVLDICWSYPLYAAEVVAAADVHMVNAPNRVVTGSVDSFLTLLGHVLDPQRPNWLTIISAMNARADERVHLRLDVPEPRLHEAEIYGVSGLSNF